MAAFLDTNIVVYAFDRSDAQKQRVARKILADESVPFTVSSQVLSEFYWVTTRKLRPSLAEGVAEAAVRGIARLANVVAVDASVVTAAIELARASHLALWDAQLIVAARRGGCDVLLTEDLNQGQTIAGVTIRNPFL